MNQIDVLKKDFARLSKSYQAKLVREAREYIEAHPGAADNNTFWCPKARALSAFGLSARQVVSCFNEGRPA